MDLTESIAPRSDQMNAEDLLAGERTFTVKEVRQGASLEQPVDIELVEFPRPFKPSKTVRRILVAAWGKDSSAYVGRRMTLYRDPAVKFGGMDVGGIRVSHLSHIAKPLTLALTVTRGKRAPYVVQPLADAPAPAAKPKVPTAEELIAEAERASSNDDLNRIARIAAANLGPSELAAVKDVVTARRAELKDKPADDWPEAAQIPGA
jgi:hypothetical protein